MQLSILEEAAAVCRVSCILREADMDPLQLSVENIFEEDAA